MRARTPRQEQILAYIETRTRTGIPPTVREIGEEFSISSPHGVHRHLNALRKQGLLSWEPRKPRTFVVLRRPNVQFTVAGKVDGSGRITWVS